MNSAVKVNALQMRQGRWRAIASALSVATLLLSPLGARAANTTYPQNTDLLVNGNTFVIVAGSQSDSLSVDTTTFTVQVAATETFTVRSMAPSPINLFNNGGWTPCSLVSGNNEVTILGPSTTTFTPSGSCAQGGTSGGGGGSVSPTITVVYPNGGESLNSGATSYIQWQTSGGSVSSIKLLLSTDSGATFPTVIATGETNDGNYVWTVPTVTTTSAARIKVEAYANGSLAGSDTSNANFTINGTAPTTAEPPATQPTTAEPPATQPTAPTAPAVDPTVKGTYTPAAALSATPTIDVDKALVVPVDKTPVCVGGTLIKGSGSAVYYCGANGKRYVFPNLGTFKSWFDDFSTLVTLTDSQIASIPLGGNVTYKPGARMVKIQTDPKVYAISRGGLLRWVQTEAVAVALYGSDWNKKIDDVSDAFFVNYQMGDSISSASNGQ